MGVWAGVVGWWQVGPEKVRCGSAAVLQPRPPAHGLHCHLSALRVHCAIHCGSVPMALPLPSPDGGQRVAVVSPGLGFIAGVTVLYGEWGGGVMGK